MKVPPLKDRVEDIPLLVNHFSCSICAEYGMAGKEFSESALKALQKLDWTGNIRELRNVVERLIILGGKIISKTDVMNYVGSTRKPNPVIEQLIEDVEDVEALKQKIDAFLNEYKTTLS